MRRYAYFVIILVVLAAFFTGASLPQLADSERDALLTRFQFARAALPTAPEAFASPEDYVKEINPYLYKQGPWVALIGSSVTMLDYDRDGLSNDLCITDPRSKVVQIAPAPGTGSRYAPVHLLEPGRDFGDKGIFPTACRSADFNRDGRVDFAVVFLGKQPTLILQDTTQAGGFAVIEMVPQAMPEWYSSVATVADVDGDDWLDLIVGNYWREGNETYFPQSKHKPVLQNSMSKAENGGVNYILRQVPGSHPARFELTQPMDSLDARSYTLAVAAGDLTGDGLPELYYANDFGPDLMYVNQSTPGRISLKKVKGKRHFSTPKSKTMGYDSFKGMGADFSDLNQDGHFDIFVSNIAGNWKLQESHFLWQNTGDTKAWERGYAPFEEVSEKIGVSRSDWSWDAKLADLDGDGRMEALQAVGGFKGKHNAWPELQQWAMGLDPLIAYPENWPNFIGTDVSGDAHNRLYVADRKGYYHDISEKAGFGGAFCSRGIAVGDVDGDGDLDVAVANLWEDSYLYTNQGRSGNAFTGARILQCADKQVNEPQVLQGKNPGLENCVPVIGAVVSLISDGKPGAAYLIDGGNGHAGGRAQEAYFGLGPKAPASLAFEVRWRQAGKLHSEVLKADIGWNTIILPRGEAHGSVLSL
jgi:enediyne biosynthesis protein E4